MPTCHQSRTHEHAHTMLPGMSQEIRRLLPSPCSGQLPGKAADMVGGMQDDTLAAQAALEKHLAAVGDDVEDINTRVGEVGCLQQTSSLPCSHS